MDPEAERKKISKGTKHCCVTKCGKPRLSGMVFHVLPSNRLRNKQWTKIIEAANGSCKTAIQVNFSSVICCDHFSDDQYNIKARVMGIKKKNLKSDAIPDLLLEEISDEIPTTSSIADLSMPYNCKVPQCSATTLKNKDLKFHSFPKEEELQERWINALCINKSLSKHSKVCSRHFTDDDYIITSLGEWKILKKSSIPTCNLPQCSTETQTMQISLTEILKISDMLKLPCDERLTEDSTGTTTDTNNGSVKNVAIQTSISLNEQPILVLSLLTEIQLHQFCGFSNQQFTAVLNLFHTKCLQTDAKKVCASLDPKEQLFLTLYKYRCNPDFMTLSIIFHINHITAKNVFILWTKKIYGKLKGLTFCKLNLKENIVIEFIEIPVIKTEDPGIQQSTLSSTRKNCNTFKALVGYSEKGLVFYCSNLYGGSFSNRKITLECGVLDILREEHCVLADRGFDILDLLEKRIKLKVLPIERKKEQLLETEIAVPSKILIQNGLSEKNDILTYPMPLYLWPIANEIFYNCYFLCNFRNVI